MRPHMLTHVPGRGLHGLFTGNSNAPPRLEHEYSTLYMYSAVIKASI